MPFEGLRGSVLDIFQPKKFVCCFQIWFVVVTNISTSYVEEASGTETGSIFVYFDLIPLFVQYSICESHHHHHLLFLEPRFLPR